MADSKIGQGPEVKAKGVGAKVQLDRSQLVLGKAFRYGAYDLSIRDQQSPANPATVAELIARVENVKGDPTTLAHAPHSDQFSRIDLSNNHAVEFSHGAMPAEPQATSIDHHPRLWVVAEDEKGSADVRQVFEIARDITKLVRESTNSFAYNGQFYSWVVNCFKSEKDFIAFCNREDVDLLEMSFGLIKKVAQDLLDELNTEKNKNRSAFKRVRQLVMHEIQLAHDLRVQMRDEMSRYDELKQQGAKAGLKVNTGTGNELDSVIQRCQKNPLSLMALSTEQMAIYCLLMKQYRAMVGIPESSNRQKMFEQFNRFVQIPPRMYDPQTYDKIKEATLKAQKAAYVLENLALEQNSGPDIADARIELVTGPILTGDGDYLKFDCMSNIWLLFPVELNTATLRQKQQALEYLVSKMSDGNDRKSCEEFLLSNPNVRELFLRRSVMQMMLWVKSKNPAAGNYIDWEIDVIRRQLRDSVSEAFYKSEEIIWRLNKFVKVYAMSVALEELEAQRVRYKQEIAEGKRFGEDVSIKETRLGQLEGIIADSRKRVDTIMQNESDFYYLSSVQASKDKDRLNSGDAIAESKGTPKQDEGTLWIETVTKLSACLLAAAKMFETGQHQDGVAVLQSLVPLEKDKESRDLVLKIAGGACLVLLVGLSAYAAVNGIDFDDKITMAILGTLGLAAVAGAITCGILLFRNLNLERSIRAAADGFQPLKEAVAANR